jgi:molybdopterin-guanine dinucleotide biosynthesis protein A
VEEARAPVSVVVLAGGRGQRLGADKATIEIAPGETLLQRALALVAPLSDDLIVVQRADQHLDAPGARVISDRPPFEGPLAGILAGIEAARQEWSLVVACDMPFLSRPLVRYLLALRPGHDVVVPRLEVGMEPLHALYHRRAAPAIQAALERGERRLISFYRALRVRAVTPDELAPFDRDGRAFFNVNAPEDLAQARAWLREAGPSP